MFEYHKFKAVYDAFIKGFEANAYTLLTELQRRYVAICNENTTLKMQIQEYEDILYLAHNLYFDETYYWLITGSIKQGPFCPKCYNEEGILMRLTASDHERSCPSCKAQFTTPLRAMSLSQKKELESLDLPTLHLEENHYRAKVLPFCR